MIEVQMGEQGRVVIPAGVRRELGLAVGDRLVLRTEGKRLVLEPRASIRERLRGQFAPLSRDGISLVDELLDERRQEARREREGT